MGSILTPGIRLPLSLDGKALGGSKSENLPCPLSFITTPGKGFMDFFYVKQDFTFLIVRGVYAAV